MQDIRQSPLWKKYGATKNWKLETLPSSDGKHSMQVIIFPIGILGLNFLKLQRSEHDPNWEELKRIKRKNWVISSVIEPIKVENPSEYKKNGYRLSNFPYLATKTIIINIDQPKNVLWKNLSENTRRLVNKNSDTIIKKVSPQKFLSYWNTSAKIWTMKLPDLLNLKKTLKNKVSFLICFKKGVCQSGLLLIESKDTANYFHTFTTAEGRVSGAHYYLVWQQMLRERRRGKKFFDFEGVFDTRWPQKRWIGFTAFKNKFGGEPVSFPGCFHRWF